MTNALINIFCQVQMAYGLRNDGKFWVVIAVIGATLAGFLIYLITLDRKLSRIEKQDKK